MQKNRKEAAWIAVAFLLLCAISAYRQISMRFFPDDPVRPVAVYFVYLLLLAGWWGAIRNRITQRNIRMFLLAEHALMLIGITTRFVQDALLYHDTYLMRVSGYWVVIPIILFPLFGLFASFGLGKTEEYRINRNWYYLLIPAGVLTFLMLTNESHRLIFRLLPDEVQSNLYFHPNAGIFVIGTWALFLMLARIYVIYRRSREMEGNPRLRSVPLLIVFFILAFNIPYLSSSFVVNIELIEYFALLFFLEAMVWESCVLVGMVPVNAQYEEVFDRSTVAMQIVGEDGHPCLKSSDAPELSAEIFELLKQQATIRTPEGQELHLHAIRGGYAVWQNDVSRTIAVIDELQRSTEKLEYEGELLRHELKVRSDEATVREQNRIYNQLTDEIGGQLLLLRSLLETQELIIDISTLFRKICLIGTYIKRRCNLRLIEQSDGSISNKDVELCYRELADCLQQMGVEANVFWSESCAFTPDFAFLTLDIFETLLEHERFELDSVRVTFKTENIFSIQVQSDSRLSGQIPVKELQRINMENHDMRWQTTEKGYQVTIYGGRS